MVRRTKTDQELDALLDAAERQCKCLVAPDRATYEALRRRLKTGEVIRPFPGMVVRADRWKALEKTPRAQWRYVQNAYRGLHPEEILCSYSAALEYGLWVSKSQLGKMHVVRPLPSQVEITRTMHRHYVPSGEIVNNHGVKMTSLMRTVLDCSLAASFPEALAIVDSALRYCNLDLQEYRQFVHQHAAGRAGASRARAAARFADGRSENGGESIVRGKIIELGYVAPVGLQVEFLDPVSKNAEFRVDMLFERVDGSEVIGEVDGWEKYGESPKTTKEALIKERQRESHLTALGIPVMRILFKRLDEPGYLENLLQSFGIPKCSENLIRS